jgi:hypothetical protein
MNKIQEAGDDRRRGIPRGRDDARERIGQSAKKIAEEMATP